MDKNRLVQIANHFDKIGAYTISDEFENKFIREGQALKPGIRNRRKSRNKVVSELAPSTESGPLESAWNAVSGFFRRQGDPVEKRNADNLSSLTYIETWKYIIGSLSTMPEYSDPKKMNILRSIKGKILKAESNLKSAIPAAISSRSISPDAPTQTRIVNAGGDNEVVLREFLAWADYEDQTYRRSINKDSYINELRSAELDFTKLAFPDAIDSTPVTPPKPTPAPSGGGTTTPSGGGARPNSGPKPPVAPSGKPSSKTTNLNVNEELSKIVFRKVKASNPKLKDDNIFLDMRIDNKYKTYLDVYKDKGLDGSIRAAIKTSSFSDEFKQKLIKRLDAKIAKAIELSKKQDLTPGSTQSTTQGTTQSTTQSTTSVPTPPEPPKDPAKPDADGFRCTREGLFTEIGRMDTMHNNDPDKYIRSYFGDIKRVIDCHESLRNSLNLKDNTQLDSLINILEAKYFSIITKTQFPY